MTPPVIVALVVAAALLSLAAVTWQQALVMSLPFIVILNGLGIPLAGRAVHLDQLAACALLVPLAASTLVGTRRLRTDSTVWWLAAILAVNLLASLIHSPARAYSLMQCVNLATAWVVYLLVINFVDTPAALDAFMGRVLWAAVAGCGLAVCAYLLSVIGLPVGGAEVSTSAAVRLTAAYGAYGTMVEPNILGSFAAAYLVLAVGLVMQPTIVADRVGRPNLLRLTIAATAVALVLSFTRAAWVAAIVGLVMIAFAGARSLGGVRLRHILAPLVVVVGAVGLLLLVPGDAGTLFRFKVLNLVNVGSQTAVMRLVTYALALQQTADHWVIGWGTFTFAPLAAQGSDFQQFDNWHNLWIGNYLLLAAHDTGVVGLALWTGLIASILVRATRVRAALREADGAAAHMVLALTAAVVVLLVAFLSTSGFSLGYSWLLLGLLGAYCHVAAERVAAPAPELPISVDVDAELSPSIVVGVSPDAASSLAEAPT